MGYRVVELAPLERSFRAELRHGAGSSTGELLVVEIVDGTSLKVTAWMVHHSRIFVGGAPQERTRYESPSALTTDDADTVIETCTDDGGPDAEIDRGAAAHRGGR